MLGTIALVAAVISMLVVGVFSAPKVAAGKKSVSDWWAGFKTVMVVQAVVLGLLIAGCKAVMA